MCFKYKIAHVSQVERLPLLIFDVLTNPGEHMGSNLVCSPFCDESKPHGAIFERVPRTVTHATLVSLHLSYGVIVADDTRLI